jgi:hypothetical protein
MELTQYDPSESGNCCRIPGEIVSISLGVIGGTGEDVGIKRLEY